MNDLEALYQQILGSGWAPDWNIQGVDRARELANLLYSQGVTSLGPLSFVNPTPQASWYNDDGSYAFDMGSGAPQQLSIGGKTLGYLGDYNNDGSYGNNTADFLKNGNLLGWSSQGHGNVGYTVEQGPNGLMIVPEWGSSSNASNARDAIKGAAFVAAAGTGMNELFGGGLGGAALGGGGEDALLGGVGDAGYGAAGAGGAGMSDGVLGSWSDWGFDPSQLGGMFSGGGMGGYGNLLNLGGNLLSGYMGSKAIGKASDAQVQAQLQALALQKQMYDQTRADLAPYRAAGTSALSQIQNLLSNPSAITSQPDYQFGLDQGTKALNNGAASRGMTYSGAQGKALQRFGNDYANTKLNESYNRLASIAGIGQQATNTGAGASANYASQGGNYLSNMGDARGSGYVGSANAWGNAIGNYLNNANQQNWLKQMGFGG